MAEPLYVEIANTLRKSIQSREYVDRLPTETELRAQFCVSISTMKKALNALVSEGLITRIPGRGTFVNSPRSDIKEGSRHAGSSDPADGQKIPRDGRSRIVGVILPEPEAVSRRLLSGIVEGLAVHHAYPLIGQSQLSQESESQIIEDFLHMGVDGLVIFPVEGELYNEDIVRLCLERFPLVLVDRWFPGISVSRVAARHRDGAKQAVEYLNGLGHRDIVLVSLASTHPDSTQSVIDRKEGFALALAQLDIPNAQNRMWIKAREEGVSERAIIEDVVSRMQLHPETSAVVCMSETDAVIVFEAARQLGLRIPEDLSVIAFDIGNRTRSLAPIVGGDATTELVAWLDQCEDVIGREAAALVHRLILQPGQHEEIEVPVILRTGQSCAPPKDVLAARHEK